MKRRIRNDKVEVQVNFLKEDIIEIIPMDDVMLEMVWSYKHKRMICVAKEQPVVQW